MNINLLGVLKRIAKNPNVRKKDIWMESETQMVSILNRSSRKQKVDEHLKNATTENDFHTGIHSWVSWFSNLTFQKNHLSTQICPLAGGPNPLFCRKHSKLCSALLWVHHPGRIERRLWIGNIF